jgi:hypothetical protein
VTTTEVGELVVRARPRRIRVFCWVAALAVVAVSALVATGLRGSTGEGPGYFQRGDQFAMIGLGVLAGLGILLFARPRVEADARGIRVRNLVGSYELPWQVVERITYGRGTPWVTLELRDDETVAVMAIQASDKDYAVRAVRGLRTLLAASQQPAPGKPASGASDASG